MLYLTAETLGKSRAPGSPPPDYAPLTVAQIARAAGCTARLMYVVLADAVQRGLIEVLDAKEAKKRGMPAPPHAQAKWYKVCPEAWKTAPKYQPKRLAAVVAIDDEEETTEATAAAATPKPWGKAVTVAPGERSRAIALAAETKKLVISRDGAAPVRVQPALNDGVLTIQIRDAEAAAPAKPASQVAELCSESVPVKRASQVVELQRGLFGVVNPLTMQHLHKPADTALVAKLAHILGDCPPVRFVLLVEKRIKRGGFDSAGLFLHIAQDARAAWDAEAPAREEQNRRAAEGDARYRAAMQAEFESCPEGYRIKYETPALDGGAWFHAVEAHESLCEACRRRSEAQWGTPQKLRA